MLNSERDKTVNILLRDHSSVSCEAEEVLKKYGIPFVNIFADGLSEPELLPLNRSAYAFRGVGMIRLFAQGEGGG